MSGTERASASMSALLSIILRLSATVTGQLLKKVFSLKVPFGDPSADAPLSAQ